MGAAGRDGVPDECRPRHTVFTRTRSLVHGSLTNVAQSQSACTPQDPIDANHHAVARLHHSSTTVESLTPQSTGAREQPETQYEPADSSTEES
jgi:hypothetical protein